MSFFLFLTFFGLSGLLGLFSSFSRPRDSSGLFSLGLGSLLGVLWASGLFSAFCFTFWKSVLEARRPWRGLWRGLLIGKNLGEACLETLAGPLERLVKPACWAPCLNLLKPPCGLLASIYLNLCPTCLLFSSDVAPCASDKRPKISSLAECLLLRNLSTCSPNLLAQPARRTCSLSSSDVAPCASRIPKFAPKGPE